MFSFFCFCCCYCHCCTTSKYICYMFWVGEWVVGWLFLCSLVHGDVWRKLPLSLNRTEYISWNRKGYSVNFASSICYRSFFLLLVSLCSFDSYIYILWMCCVSFYRLIFSSLFSLISHLPFAFTPQQFIFIQAHSYLCLLIYGLFMCVCVFVAKNATLFHIREKYVSEFSWRRRQR